MNKTVRKSANAPAYGRKNSTRASVGVSTAAGSAAKRTRQNADQRNGDFQDDEKDWDCRQNAAPRQRVFRLHSCAVRAAPGALR